MGTILHACTVNPKINNYCTLSLAEIYCFITYCERQQLLSLYSRITRNFKIVPNTIVSTLYAHISIIIIIDL